MPTPFPAQALDLGQPAWLPRHGRVRPCRSTAASCLSGQYSCDSLSSSIYDGDPRYISYANFLDGRQPTSQSPYKPYAALQNQDFNGWGIHGNVAIDLNDSMQLYYIGSWREYTTKFGQDQDASPVPLAQLDNRLDHRAWSSGSPPQRGDRGQILEYTSAGSTWTRTAATPRAST